MAIQQTRRALAPDRAQDRRSATDERPQEQPDRTPRLEPWRYGPKDSGEERLAKALGWFSIGLGLAELLAPKRLAQFIGAGADHPVLFRFLGLREIASGIGILAQRRPAPWVWSRVAGDAMDLSLLGAALLSPGTNKSKVYGATAAVLGVTILDVANAQQLSRPHGNREGFVRVATVTIRKSPEELYQFWHNFENLPRFMAHLESVRVDSGGRSHWVARGPAGMNAEWDAETIEDRANELIAWRSLEGAEVKNSGSVRFERAPAGRGTVVRVEIEYSPPGGALGVGIATLFGEEPEQQARGDLHRLKQLMETGEIVQSDASLHRGPHPAQPSADR